MAKMCIMNPWCYALYLENHNYPAGKIPLSNFISMSSQSLTRADENGSGDIGSSLVYRRRGSVSSSLRSYKTDTPNFNR